MKTNSAALKFLSIVLAALLAGFTGIAAAQGGTGTGQQVDCEKTPNHPDCKKK